jgi:hypothetical protein
MDISEAFIASSMLVSADKPSLASESGSKTCRNVAILSVISGGSLRKGGSTSISAMRIWMGATVFDFDVGLPKLLLSTSGAGGFADA